MKLELHLVKYNFICCLIFSLILFVNSETNVERKLSVVVNPDCNINECKNSNNPRYNLVYIRADGPNDTLHNLWSSIGSFTILTALTSPKGNLSIDWKKLLSNNSIASVNFSENPVYLSAVSFIKLWEFDDEEDTADFDNVPSNSKIANSFSNFNWNNVTLLEDTMDKVIAEFSLSDDNVINESNVTFIKLSIFGNDGRIDVSPKLLYNSNITQVEIVLDKFKTNFIDSRFALDIILTSSDKSQRKFIPLESKSLDDEYTPGIFSVTEILHESNFENETTGYLQWKPLCYTSPDRSVENSTTVNLNLLEEKLNETFFREELNESLIIAVNGYGYDNMYSQLAEVSFGATEDKFYKHTNYSVWTLNIGYGSLPKDEISLTVILVILIGLGIPLLLILGGGIYIGVKRFKRKKDDLLLEQ